ncbi:hypothetical protein TNCV_1073001 [Trichonephila clavipes]|nr:hypothetical protein TNCV_1073001 [Trichonephila clavipes]
MWLAISSEFDIPAVAQPVAVEGKKGGLFNVPLISAEDETYEEKEKTPVDVIQDKAKDDLNPIILYDQSWRFVFQEKSHDLCFIGWKEMERTVQSRDPGLVLGEPTPLA